MSVNWQRQWHTLWLLSFKQWFVTCRRGATRLLGRRGLPGESHLAFQPQEDNGMHAGYFANLSPVRVR
ncbi:MAG TPA: hypothetical protein VE988_10545, partial [Gemmataceae bacterium]|nr:hypothetical protein [Gemmataceae bacterium]